MHITAACFPLVFLCCSFMVVMDTRVRSERSISLSVNARCVYCETRQEGQKLVKDGLSRHFQHCTIRLLIQTTFILLFEGVYHFNIQIGWAFQVKGLRITPLKTVSASPLSLSLQVFVKCHFDYDPANDNLIPCKEAGLMFSSGDVLQIVNQEDVNWWQVGWSTQKH